MGYDIALLKLAEKLNFTGQHKNLVPICLPEDEEDQKYDGKLCVATGWGMTNDSVQELPNVLQKAAMPVFNFEKCKKFYKFPLNDKHICAGEALHQTCHADSGGPLQCQREDKTWVQIGITSFGNGLCETPEQGVFERVQTMRQWIRDVIANN